MRRRFLRPGLAHAARVALAASLLVCIVYAGCAAVLNVMITARLTGEIDARLQERIADISEAGLRPSADDDDAGTAPVYLWHRTAAGPAAVPGAAGPRLPARLDLDPGRAVTVKLKPGSFRLYAAGRYVAGQGLGDQEHLLAVLRDGEALAAPVLLLAMFAGALTIGLRALSPVEQSRKRQLEFTADASHELRTPLSVISAETSIALSAPRAAADYQEALQRISGESRRLQRIVEDMLVARPVRLGAAAATVRAAGPGHHRGRLRAAVRRARRDAADRGRSPTSRSASRPGSAPRPSGSTGWPGCWPTTPAGTRAAAAWSASA